MRFFKNASQKSSPWAGKKNLCDLVRVHPKRCVQEKKWRESPKKLKNNDRRRAWNKKISHLCVCSKTHSVWCMWTNVSECAKLCKRHHTQLNGFFLVLFSLILLQQVFCKIPANQIIISTFSQLLYNLILKKSYRQRTKWIVFIELSYTFTEIK